MTDAPTTLVLVGAPDGMARATADEQEERLDLPGNSGLLSALVATLRERGHPHKIAVLWPEGELDIHDVLDKTGADVLVNGICEPMAQRGALQKVDALERETGLPMCNRAAAIIATARPQTARLLSGRAGVRTPSCSLYHHGGGTLVDHVHAHGHRYPVLLRPLGTHGSVGLVKADDDDAVEAHSPAFAAGTVTDFVDFRSDDGHWRKYRVIAAGGTLFRRHLLIDAQWNLVGDSRFYMHANGLLAEEREWLSRPFSPDDDSVDARVLDLLRATELEFAAMDYTVTPDGDVVPFEVNACVRLTGTIPEQYREHIGYIEDNNDQILDALVQRIHALPA